LFELQNDSYRRIPSRKTESLGGFDLETFVTVAWGVLILSSAKPGGISLSGETKQL